MVVLRGEGGVAVTQPVHHGAAGDDDGRKQGADAVLEGWKLQKGREKKKGRKSVKKKESRSTAGLLRLLLTPWPSSCDAPYCSWICCWYSGSVQWKRTSALSLAISKHFIWTADALLPRFAVVSCLLQRLHAHYAGKERDKEQTTNCTDVWV